MPAQKLIPVLWISAILLLASACSIDDDERTADTGQQATSTPVDDPADEPATAEQATSTQAETTPTPGQDDHASEPAATPSNTPSTDGDGGDADTADESDPAPTAMSEGAEDQTDEPESPAPELGSIDEWHNSEPMTLADLRGSTVLLVFWADF
ncbi:MAG: hypothetical protein ACOC9Y_02880 [Chloroflexota bacterium]